MKKLFLMVTYAMVLCVSCFLFCPFVCAEDQTGNPQESAKEVKLIEVKQNKSVSTPTIIAKIRTAPGEIFSKEVLNEDIKRLYATGYFTDVSVDVQGYEDGVKVIFIITEKPIIRQILFEGNRSIQAKRLQDIVKSKEGEFLDNRQLKDDVSEIYKLYEKKGFHLAQVNYSTTVDANTNKVQVIFTVDEGIKSKVRNIFLTGNASFKTKKLLKLMKTRKAALFSSGYFKEEVFDEDIERLKIFYEDNGFIEAKVGSSLEYTSGNRFINIHIEVSEGKKYFVGETQISGNKIFDVTDIKSKLKMKKNSVFSQSALKKDEQNIQDLYFEQGYIFADVRSATVVNESTGSIDVTYNIAEGELCYVDKIIVKGNTKTKDVVIRRELRIFPGDKFDGVKLRRSKEKLYNLGYFEEIGYDIEEGSAPTKKNLVVTVKETKTGEFSFGGGYSSIDRLVGFIEIAQNNFDIMSFPNFTGAGQVLRIRAELGKSRRDYLVSFTEPWIFGRPVSFGFDLYRRTQYRSGTSGFSYDEQRTGGDVRLGRSFGEFNRGELTYRLEEVKISDVPADASEDFTAEEGANVLSSLNFLFSRDTSDNIFNPTRGYNAYISTEVTGGPFGGDKDFISHNAGGSVYFTHFKNFVLELKLRAGIVDVFSNAERVPIYERFFAGGANTIRGYKERKVGPKDISGEPIGGKSLLIGNAEYTFPLFEYLKGAVFYDVGNVWSKISDIGSGGYKAGAGLGVRVKTPLGPIKVDFGYPLSKTSGEKKQGRFYFNMTRGF
ncbi:MAG: outer membrane protein assembly factor BamA [Candidatus Omnitrophota bacterium]